MYAHPLRKPAAHRFAKNVRRKRRPLSAGIEEIVLGGLATHLADHGALELGLCLFSRLIPLFCGQVVQRDAPLEDDRQPDRPQWSPQVTRLPFLVTTDAYDAEAEVVVHADHIGEDVVAVIVGVAPLRRRAHHVPLPRIGVDLRVIHPIPLSVGDVVAELHILDALRCEQSERAGRPAGLAPAGPNRQPGGDFKATLKTYDALDVCAVVGAERLLDITTDLIQRRPEGLDVRFAQVGVFSYFCDGNAASHPIGRWDDAAEKTPVDTG